MEGRWGWLPYRIFMKCPGCGEESELLFSSVETEFEVPVDGQRVHIRLPVKYWVCKVGHPCLPARGDEQWQEWPLQAQQQPWQVFAPAA